MREKEKRERKCERWTRREAIISYYISSCRPTRASFFFSASGMQLISKQYAESERESESERERERECERESVRESAREKREVTKFT